MTIDLVKFDEVKAEIAKYKVENKSLVFEYETSKGNKDARSHIFKLRKTKSKIAEVHKIIKADALAVCQAIDKEKRDLTADIEEMIEVHAYPIREIEERAKRIEAEKLAEEEVARTAEEERKRKEIEARELEVARKEAEIRAREDAIKAEQEKARLEVECIEREKRIVAAAAENARKEAEKKAEAEKRAIMEAADKAKADAEAKVLAEKNARIAKEAADKAEKEYLAEIERKRVEDKKHRQLIEADIYEQIDKIIDNSHVTERVVNAIIDGKIDNLTINY